MAAPDIAARLSPPVCLRHPSLDEVKWPEIPFPFWEHCILVGRRGSEAHGTYMPPQHATGVDDRDLLGVMVPPVRYYFGFGCWEGKDQIRDEWDVVLYELRKFLSLCARQNPGVLQMLWLEPEDYLFISPPASHILKARDLFRDRELAYNSFLGYAKKQLDLMTRGAPYHGYMGQKRRALVDKFGYDTKNAAHCVRLLRTGYDYLTTGTFKVRRTDDVDLILAVKRGEFSLQNVTSMIQDHIAMFERGYQESVLRSPIDMGPIEDLAVSIIRGWSR